MLEASLFRAVAATVDELVFVWRPTGELVWANDAFVRETGLTPEDFGFRNEDNPFVHPDDLPHVLEQMGAFLGSDAKRSPPIANRFIDAWGRARPISSVVHKVDWDGAPGLLLVSKLVVADDQRTDADERYRELVEAADDGILELSKDGRIVYSNRRFQQLTSARPVELARRAFAELLHVDDRALASEAIERVGTERTSVAFEARLDGGGTEPRWLAIHISPVMLRHAPVQMLVIARDVTEARALDDRLRQRQRLESLGVLVGGIAHDLNNIVTVVLANAGLATQLAPAGTRLAELINDMRLAGERARGLSGSLLAYAGKAPTAISIVDVDRVIDETVHLVGAITGGRVQFVRVGGASAVVRGDPGQLGQVVLNLLTNAVDAMSERGGSVTVETSTTTIVEAAVDAGDGTRGPAGRWLPEAPGPGRYARVLVQDAGCGMAPETLERIFDPFFSTKGLGRGLGLSALLGIVERHRGHLRVTTKLGAGTTFEVLLPAAAAAEVVDARAAQASAQPAATAAEGEHTGAILVVDDEPMIRSVVRQILEYEGYDVTLAGDAFEALAVFNASPDRFSAAIVDFAMPGIDGNELIRRLRAVRADLPVIQASGWREEAREGERLEAVVQLAKPFQLEELVEAVKTAALRTKR